MVLVLPPTAAYAWTRYRYSSGWTGGSYGFVDAQTSGYLHREYNAAYRSSFCYTWEVSYIKTDGTTGQLYQSDCSPTEIGASTYDVKARCRELLKSANIDYTYNCDTTVP